MERLRRVQRLGPAGSVAAIVVMLWAGPVWLMAQPILPLTAEDITDGGPPQQATSELVTASAPIVTDTPSRDYEVAFTVTNNTDLAVTAWEVDVECRYTDGTTRMRSLGRESYRSYEDSTPGAPVEKNFIVRHGTSIGRLEFPAKAGQGLVVTRIVLRWAVFADGSGIGDPVGRASLFNDREKMYQKWAAVLAALQAAQASPSGSASLADALERIVALESEQDGVAELVTKQIRRNLEMAISHKVPPDDFIAQQIALAERELRYVDAHRRPR
jgi:hypothetical protein